MFFGKFGVLCFRVTIVLRFAFCLITHELILDGKTLSPNDFDIHYLRSSGNKNRLNLFLAKRFMDLQENESQVLLVTFKDTILSSNETVLTEEVINICNIKGTDARLVGNCINLSQQDFKHIMLCTADTNVFTLLLAELRIMLEHGATTIFINLGTGFRTEFYDIIEIRGSVGYNVCKGLPFSHDSTINFYRHGMCIFWDNWVNNDNFELTNAFIERSNIINFIRGQSS